MLAAGPARTHFTEGLKTSDRQVFDALEADSRRQADHIELIASENVCSLACLEAIGHSIANKALEGYPGKRYHGGAEFSDVLEQLAIDRARELFDCSHANVQPHSGTQANQAVYFAALRPGDLILSMDLNAGGHLSHGAPVSLAGRWLQVSSYAVDAHTGLLDYDRIEHLALQRPPRLIIAGVSAYPRIIDFRRMRRIADKAGALLLVDMAHFGGLVAAGVYPSPVPWADVVTCTFAKTMRGGPGAMILSNRDDLAKKLNAAVFPGIQGGAQMNEIAAKAVALGEALKPEFRSYGHRVVRNARIMAEALHARGLKTVTGGTDTHLLVVDLSNTALSGAQAQELLEQAHITSNSNPVPGDTARPSEWKGLRLGSSAATTRGFDEADFAAIGNWIADLLLAEAAITDVRTEVLRRCADHPLYR